MQPAIIQEKIYEVRGQKLMFDFDLAELYIVPTKALKQAVRRNASRFPADFMFQLSREEFENLRSQIVTSSWGGTRYLPFAFTEHGVTMLASVLNSERAIAMNIAIVRAFISLRQLTLQHTELAIRLEELRTEMQERFGVHDIQLASLYNAIEKLLNKKMAEDNWEQRERIGFIK